jgi:hypothetical protein
MYSLVTFRNRFLFDDLERVTEKMLVPPERIFRSIECIIPLDLTTVAGHNLHYVSICLKSIASSPVDTPKIYALGRQLIVIDISNV